MSTRSSVVSDAYSRIEGHVRRTPVIRIDGADLGVDHMLDVKLEFLQHSGSFKARGVANHFLTRQIGPAGVVAASGGNHGVAVAWGAQRFGHRAAVFVPTIAAAKKVARLVDFGAEIHQVGENFEGALGESLGHRDRTGAEFIHPYDDPLTVAGAGSVGLELDEQVEGLDTVLIACGGGGLASGVASWFGDRVKIVTVESFGTPTLHAALAAGRPVDITVDGVTADALGATCIGDLPFEILSSTGVQSVLVDDHEIVAAQQALLDRLQVYVEPSAAAPLAALRTGSYRPADGERVALVLCGANGDPATLP